MMWLLWTGGRPVGLDRRGITVVEVLVALLTTALVLQLSLRALADARRIGTSVLSQVDGVEAVRTTRALLRRELRVGLPGRDWTAFSPDSIRLRAFRGVGRVCPGNHATAELLVDWRGVRRPDAQKDSVLFLVADGSWHTSDLVAVRASNRPCEADQAARVDAWTLSTLPPERVVLVRVYESGSYHIADRALRYRPGMAGRQPLTGEVLATPQSGFFTRGDVLGIALEGRRRSWTWEGFLAQGSVR